MPGSLFERLSDRERECLRLVHERLSSKEIAGRLKLSHHTVNDHLRSAKRSLECASRVAAARMLAEHEKIASLNDDTQPLGIADREHLRLFPSENSDTQQVGIEVRDSASFRHERVDVPRLSIPLPFPTRGRRRNDLTIGERLAVTTVLLMLLILTVGFFVQASKGLLEP